MRFEAEKINRHRPSNTLEGAYSEVSVEERRRTAIDRSAADTAAAGGRSVSLLIYARLAASKTDSSLGAGGAWTQHRRDEFRLVRKVDGHDSGGNEAKAQVEGIARMHVLVECRWKCISEQKYGIF